MGRSLRCQAWGNGDARVGLYPKRNRSESRALRSKGEGKVWRGQFLSQKLPKDRGPRPRGEVSRCPWRGLQVLCKCCQGPGEGSKEDPAPWGVKEHTNSPKSQSNCHLEDFLDLNLSEGSFFPYFSGSLRYVSSRINRNASQSHCW